MTFLYFLQQCRNAVLDTFFQTVTFFGEESILLFVVVALYWCINKKAALQLMFITFCSTAVNGFLKIFFQVPRPWVKDPQFNIVESARKAATGYSFPSGHTQASTTFYGTLGLKAKGILKAFCFTLIPFIAFSRMYLGVHTPQDVLMALVVGIVLVAITDVLFKRVKPLYLFIGLTVIVATLCIAMPFLPKKETYDALQAQNIMKDTFLVFGGVVATVLATFIEQKYVRFNEQAPLLVQAIKLILGFALLLALRVGLKPVFQSFLPPNFATFMRYFCITFFAVCVWPLSFKPLEKMFEKFHKK